MPDLTPQLASMSTEDLTELLEDEDKFSAFVRREAAKAHIVKVCTHTLQLFVQALVLRLAPPVLRLIRDSSMGFLR